MTAGDDRCNSSTEGMPDQNEGFLADLAERGNDKLGVVASAPRNNREWRRPKAREVQRDRRDASSCQVGARRREVLRAPRPSVQPHDSYGSFAKGLPKNRRVAEATKHVIQVTEVNVLPRTTSLPPGSVVVTMSDEATFSSSLLVGLTPEQREAVTSPARRLLVRATAGSGKTHVLTLRIQRRVAEGDVAPDHILAMTFTRKAGDELRRRLMRAGVRDVRAGTFHRAALNIVTQYREDHHLRPLTLEPNRRKLVSALATQLRESGEFKIEEWQLPRLEQEIGWALSQGFNGVAYAKNARRLRRDTPLPPAQIAELLDRYVGLCRSRGVVDFDLLLTEAINLLRDETDVLASFRYRNRSLYVDETQDMNPLQFMLLRQMAGEDPDLFVVGDPNQSIYGFNGATPTMLNELLTTWPDTLVLDLTRNHRSTANIIAVANTLLEEGARGIVPANDEGEIPIVRSYNTDEEEAEHVATWLAAKHQPGSAWRSMAVLARTNAQLEVIAGYLEAAGIPNERRGPEHSPASDLMAPDVSWRRLDEVERDAVALSTIHRAKGLEFQHVAAIGWAEGQLPNYNATSPEQLAEEQRLAYVALSRAEHSLLITWSKGRNDPRYPDRSPSRFLAPIEHVIAELEARDAPLRGEAPKARLDAIRASLTASVERLEENASR
jgi:DNA helicase-2/ATP-dependent DNA helicase PcrA